MTDDLHEARIRAAAHLSVARMHLETAGEAMTEAVGRHDAPLDALDAARLDLDNAADIVMGPLGLANVLDTVEESMSTGVDVAGAEVTVGLVGRRAILAAMVKAREEADADEWRSR